MLQKTLNAMELSINFSKILIKPKLVSQPARFRDNWGSLQDSNLHCTRPENLEKTQVSVKGLTLKCPLLTLMNFIIFCENRIQRAEGSDLSQFLAQVQIFLSLLSNTTRSVSSLSLLLMA